MGSQVSIGAVLRSDQAYFNVWAPDRTKVEVVLEGGQRTPMELGQEGYWSAAIDNLPPGTRYGYALDGSARVLPDPASRFQPDGPHGLSELIDPEFQWTDDAWKGVSLTDAVLYELHVGTFTREGTYQSAMSRLPHLAALGVTLIELMPLADFAGGFGWGYDGVNFYAPHRAYGRPEDLRRFTDAAHGAGIGVILDVVYNHVGPEGDHLPEYCSRYYSDRATEWGPGFNYDGKDSRAVRDYIAGNAEYWIREYHLDGLRLDATQSIFDRSSEHIISELARRARSAAGERTLVLIAENEPQDTNLIRPPVNEGLGLDAVWNDDFHHSAMVALLGSREAYYTDYLGRAQEFIAAAKYGYLYQGQYYNWQNKRRGIPALDLHPRCFVAFLENHDQVANTSRGERLRYRAHPAQWRAATAMLLLGPWTPMLFQGQEFASKQRFMYFADFAGELAQAVRRGRGESLGQFPSYASRAVQDELPVPNALTTFEQSKLDWDECTQTNGHRALALHRDLLKLRREDPTIRACLAADSRCFDVATLTDHAFVLRYFGQQGADQLLVVNLGAELTFKPSPEPLLGPPRDARWSLVWSSEDPRYGGNGVPEQTNDDHGWRFPGYSALLFESVPRGLE
jgi:maltooligosyltrehalose trehalohydrolase